MDWKEMTVFRRVMFVLFILCVIAEFTLTVLNFAGVLESVDILEAIIDCVFWLSACIAFWKKKSLFSILCLTMLGLQIICVII